MINNLLLKVARLDLFQIQTELFSLLEYVTTGFDVSSLFPGETRVFCSQKSYLVNLTEPAMTVRDVAK